MKTLEELIEQWHKEHVRDMPLNRNQKDAIRRAKQHGKLIVGAVNSGNTIHIQTALALGYRGLMMGHTAFIGEGSEVWLSDAALKLVE